MLPLVLSILAPFGVGTVRSECLSVSPRPLSVVGGGRPPAENTAEGFSPTLSRHVVVDRHRDAERRQGVVSDHPETEMDTAELAVRSGVDGAVRDDGGRESSGGVDRRVDVAAAGFVWRAAGAELSVVAAVFQVA